VDGLTKLGWQVDKPKASFYVWIATPNGMKSTEVTARLIKDAGVVTTPGVGFGEYGEGYIRMTVTTSTERLAEAVDRLAAVSL
jgi:LL-diaminopimelate aminotransferase